MVVESWSRRFNSLKPAIRKTALKLGRFLRIKRASVEILLVGDGFMKKNVLSFPAPRRFPRPDTKNRALGEIYLNPAYIRKNGEDLTYMLTHGLLHLLGYDHKKKNDIIRMENKERKLMKQCNQGTS